MRWKRSWFLCAFFCWWYHLQWLWMCCYRRLCFRTFFICCGGAMVAGTHRVHGSAKSSASHWCLSLIHISCSSYQQYLTMRILHLHRNLFDKKNREENRQQQYYSAAMAQTQCQRGKAWRIKDNRGQTDVWNVSNPHEITDDILCIERYYRRNHNHKLILNMCRGCLLYTSRCV